MSQQARQKVARMAAYISSAKARRDAELKEQLAEVTVEGRTALARVDELRADEAVLRNSMHLLQEGVASTTQTPHQKTSQQDPTGEEAPF